MDMSQYRDLFIAEAGEHLGGMSECISRLARDAADKDAIDSLFRYAHSIKGMAASMGYDPIAELAHAMEDLMDGVRKGAAPFTAASADLLLDCVDCLHGMLHDVANDAAVCSDVSDLIRRLKNHQSPEESDRAGNNGPAAVSAVRTEGDNCPGPADAPVPLNRRVDPLQTVRVKTEILDNLINITGELVTAKHRLMMIAQELGATSLNEEVAELSKLFRELHSEVLKVRLMPFAAIADRFSGVVRDLAKKSGKKVDFEIQGKEIEVDRGILEELADPLVHLLRNAVDHGLEAAAERFAAGKPADGRIRLAVGREKDQVVVTVSDDGRGMDPAVLIESAIERKLIRQEERATISPRQAFMLTCIPGFSTAQQITDISGRGVGMDVVRFSVQSLGGSLSIDSTVGSGTRIDVKIPANIAIIPVLLVSCSSLTVGFPVVRILRTVDLKRSQIMTRETGKVFSLDGETISLLSLNRLLGVPLTRLAGDYLPTIVTELRGKKVGLIADRFEGQQEVFLKPLGRPLAELRCVAGAAILGDGRVVVVLDAEGLL